MTDQSCSLAPTLLGRTNLSESEERPRAELLETVRRAQQGDAAAFERIYRLHSQRVYGLCLRMVRNPTEAEDLTQEAFLRAFRKIQTFRGESAFSTWLYRLALNVVLMQLRKNNLRPVSLEARERTNEGTGEPCKAVASPDPKPTGMINRLHLKRAVERLPLARKIVFVLHDVQGYKHREIAKMMDCSVGTSKGRLHRAHKQLRRFLRGTSGECMVSC